MIIILIRQEGNILKLINKNNSGYFFFFTLVLNTFFGWQILKTFLSLLVNYYRERPNIDLTDVAIYALITFMLVFFTGFLFKIRTSHLIWILPGGISIIRLALQVNPWPPLSLAISALGTILWLASFIFFMSLLQQKRVNLFYVFMPGLVFGIGLDTAIHSLLGTWDMIWRSDPFIAADMLLATAVQFWLILNLYNGLKEAKPTDGRKTVFYTLIIFLPFIFLQLFKFQNIASHNAISGFSSIISITIVLISNIAAITFLYLYRFKKAKLPLTIIAAIALILSFWPNMSGYFYTLQMIFGNISSFWLVLVILDKAAGISENRNPWKNTFAIGISGLLFFIFTFLYYGGYDMVLPFSNWMIPLLLSIVLGIFALLSVTLRYSSPPGEQNKRSGMKDLSIKFIPLYLIVILLIVPLILVAPPKNPDAPFKEELPLRIMDYNIHMGFNIKGYLDLEKIARVIEGNGADVVALQEVSRGWVINGSVDTLQWLADRLDMHYIFMPASDAVWGNAVLSKYPMKLVKSGFLPRMDVPLRRSYLIVTVEIPDGKNINILCTHLHQIKEEGEVREKQVQELLKQWDGLERTAIMGDFNAEKGDEEIEMMYSAGLIDSQLASGMENKLTWTHYEPFKRIDYIWVTPDLKISNLKVPYSTVSDHLPIVVNVE